MLNKGCWGTKKRHSPSVLPVLREIILNPSVQQHEATNVALTSGAGVCRWWSMLSQGWNVSPDVPSGRCKSHLLLQHYTFFVGLESCLYWTGNSSLCYSTDGSGTPLHPRPLEWRMRMKHYSLSTYHQASIWVQNLLVFVQSSPLMNLQLTACKQCNRLPSSCLLWNPINILVCPCFPWPSEFQGRIESSWSKSTQYYPGIADGIFKAVSGLCSSTFSFRDKHRVLSYMKLIYSNFYQPK